MTITAGVHKIKATGEFKFGESTEKKTPYVAVVVEVIETGDTIAKSFFLSEAAYKRAAEELRLLGWDGDSLETLDGLGTTECYGTFANEPSYKDPTKSYMVLKWINATDKPAGGLNVSKELDKSAVRDLAVKFGAAKSKKPGVPF